jgi:hypothetical protein
VFQLGVCGAVGFVANIEQLASVEPRMRNMTSHTVNMKTVCATQIPKPSQKPVLIKSSGDLAAVVLACVAIVRGAVRGVGRNPDDRDPAAAARSASGSFDITAPYSKNYL